MKTRTVRTALLLLTIIVSGSRSGTTQSQQPSSAARGQQTPTAAQPQQAPSPTAMTPYERSNLWLQTATLIVLTITLIVLAVYTGYTRTLAKAAVEEMSRPCVEVFQQTDQSSLAITSGHSSSLAGDRIAFKNIGTGAALNFRFTVQTDQGKASLAGPSLAPAEVFQSSVSRQSLSDPATVTCEFETLSGTKYRTESIVEDRRWVRSTRFEKTASKGRNYK